MLTGGELIHDPEAELLEVEAVVIENNVAEFVLSQARVAEKPLPLLRPKRLLPG